MLETVLVAYEAGMDFADALHWLKNQHCATFLSFDHKLVKKSLRLKEKLNLSVEIQKP